ncbi:MAG: hypothetical protein ACYDGO_13150 [Smithellaceae bacterium]
MKHFKPRIVWLLSWKHWILLFLVLVLCLAVFLVNAHRFLAVTNRVADADILVVEEWSADVVGQAAAREFMKGNYHRLLISGLRESFVQENKTKNVRKTPIAQQMVSLGIPKDRIKECFAPATESHRSAAMAGGVREALRQGGIKSKGVNVMAPATHARKTWLVHRRALLPETPVGIIAVLPGVYDPARWWMNRQSAKWVLKNYVGLFYEWVTGL